VHVNHALVPLLGKKAGDFRIWQRAVAAWNDPTKGALRWQRLARLASELRAHRDPSHDVDYTRVDISTEALSGFLAGFASAEAHFGCTRTGHPRFVIKLRADDTAILSLLANRFEVGRLVAVPASDRGRPQTAWLVTRLEELPQLVSVFDGHPPMGRAGRVYVTLLQAWARDRPPPYTATSYQRWRSEAAAGAPNRTTLARFFETGEKLSRRPGYRPEGPAAGRRTRVLWRPARRSASPLARAAGPRCFGRSTTAGPLSAGSPRLRSSYAGDSRTPRTARVRQ
jgi:hypothetical protein